MRVTMRNCRALGALAVAGALALATAGPAAADFSATEGAQFSGQVATFQDACVSDPPEIGTPTTYTCPSPGDYSATIHWGDGASSAGSVSGGTDCGGGHAANHTCTFAVSGTHTYSEENGYSVTVDWSASASGFGDGTTSAATASVGDAALSPIGGLSPSMIETDTGPVNVGRFSDANPSAFAANFTAVVHWGDGTSSSGGVTIDGSGGFYVYGAHGYPEEGTYTVTADVTDDGGATTQTSSSMTITAGPLRAPSDTTRPTFLGSGVFGHAYSMPQLGPFFDDVSPGPAGDYAVNVSWGDGTSGDGTVTGRNPSFGPGYIAGGTHTYGSSTPGPLPVVWSGREVEAGGASTGSLVNVVYLTAPLTGVEGSSA
ncbi:MAG: large repetitive protein, partial [Thermoleophilaceae bacterium]|nr:large repetitive protein [Thermoleophilaceae bacterium]